MELLLTFLLLLSCYNCIAEGREFAPYISNGKPVEDIDKYNFLVVISALFPAFPLEAICGGTILNEHWILTSARCTRIGSPNSIYASYGILELQDRYKYLSMIDKYVVHPNFSASDLTHDVGLFHTKSPMPIGSLVQPVKIYEGEIGETDVFQTLGWGQTVPNGQLSNHLQYKNMTLTDYETCTEELPDAKILQEFQHCSYGTRGGGGPCAGDVGSPLLKLPGLEQVDIMSWGGQCQEGKPSVSTYVKKYLDWINKIIAE